MAIGTASSTPAFLGRQFSVLGDGEQRRDFTFVDDVVDANVQQAMDAELEPGTVVNIGTGSSTSLNRVIEIVTDVLGRGIARCEDDSRPGRPAAHRSRRDPRRRTSRLEAPDFARLRNPRAG